MEIDIVLLKEAALKLSPNKKIQLINALSESLKAVGQDEIDQTWLDESKDRLQSYRRDEVNAVDGETTLTGLKVKLSQRKHTAY
jgi:putative addiction module component (TIGR02574 family)